MGTGSASGPALQSEVCPASQTWRHWAGPPWEPQAPADCSAREAQGQVVPGTWVGGGAAPPPESGLAQQVEPARPGWSQASAPWQDSGEGDSCWPPQLLL